MAGGMTTANLRAGIWRRLIHAAGFVFIIGSAQAAETVQSLHYHTALFHYFQQDYFNALTELMVAQQDDEPGPDRNNTELLRGGASLSYGMERAAEQIFERQLTEPGGSPDRDRAWFYLGKLAWQRGALDRSAAALDQMSPTYHGQLALEALYLRASISLRQGQEQLAASYDTLLPADSPWLYYLYYNLGASHAASGDWTAAIGYFQRVVESPLSTPVMQALRDKALTASGYAHLAMEDYQQAARDFSRVRLDSPLVDRALLGYGWAYSGMGHYRSAITPWQTLGERSLLSDSVRESLLASPYAHEQLGRRRTALELYQHAGDVYEAELAKVHDAIVVFRDGDLSQQLALASDTSQDWLNSQDMMPRGEHLSYIRQLVSKQNFQVAMRELRDLNGMARYLSGASQRLRVLAEADENAGQQRQAGNSLRILALQERVRLQQVQVKTGLHDARTHIRQLAIAELQQQAEKLQRALGQSRVAVARLYGMAGPEVKE